MRLEGHVNSWDYAKISFALYLKYAKESRSQSGISPGDPFLWVAQYRVTAIMTVMRADKKPPVNQRVQ